MCPVDLPDPDPVGPPDEHVPEDDHVFPHDAAQQVPLDPERGHEFADAPEGHVSGDEVEHADAPQGAEAPEPARHVGHVSPKEFFTPGVLQKLCPPHCFLSLDQKAHRFLIKFKKRPDPDTWGPAMRHMSYSKTFRNMDWEEALKDVDSEAWRRWELAKEQRDFCLAPDKVQVPGQVSQDVLEALKDVISKMPPPVKYPRL